MIQSIAWTNVDLSQFGSRDIHLSTIIANLRFPLKSVAGKPFPAFPVHAQHVILRIW